MRSLKTLLLLVGVFGIVRLVLPTTVLAGTHSCSTTDFDISVTVTHANGRSTYVYNLTRADANLNKFFIYLLRGLNETGDFKFHCNGGSFDEPNCSGGYKFNGDDLSGSALAGVWDDNKHNDGLQVTSVAVGTFPITIDVTEREPGREQEDETSILIPVGSKLQTCGPIEGPMQARKRSLVGNPLVQTVTEQTFANGCTYLIQYDPVTLLITGMEAVTEFGTGNPPDHCIVTQEPNVCENELEFPFCPPARINNPPLQTAPGGTCYYPSNLKFPC